MFHKTRKRLTLLFTGLTMIFLISFIFVTYFWLTELITSDQKEAVIRLAENEMTDHKEDLLEWYEDSHYDHDEEYDDDDDYEYKYDYNSTGTTNRMFYYVISKEGELIKGENVRKDLNEEILQRLNGWKPANLEIQYESFTDRNGKKVELLLAGASIYEHGENIGLIYTGMNVSSQQEILHQLLMILVILFLLFLILSFFLSYFMAGKAMVPISRSFQRQKEFVSDASHELRTPLSVIQSSIEVIKVEEQEKLSQFSNQVLEDMDDEIKRMTKLVSDLLTLARSDSGSLEVQFENFNLEHVLKHLARLLTPLANKNNIKISLEVDENLMIVGDKERLSQLLFILIDNAIKYNKPNGEIVLRAFKETKYIKIEVEDTGIGIPEEQRHRIFDRFYRVDKSRSRELGSNGIGLSIAKWIITAHNGDIDVTSHEGKGSIFTVKLPYEKIGGNRK